MAENKKTSENTQKRDQNKGNPDTKNIASEMLLRKKHVPCRVIRGTYLEAILKKIILMSVHFVMTTN